MSVILALMLAGHDLAETRQTITEEQTAHEIVVIGRKLKKWRGRVKSHNGELVCQTRKSTGDPAIDAIGCNAMLICFGPVHDAMERVANSDASRENKNEKMNAIASSVGECVYETRERGIEALAMQRTRE